MGILKDIWQVHLDFEEGLKSINKIGVFVAETKQVIKPRLSYSYWENGKKIIVNK